MTAPKKLTQAWTSHTLALIALRQLSVLISRAVEVLDKAPRLKERGFSEEDARSWKVMELHIRQASIAAAMVRERHGERTPQPGPKETEE